MMIIAAENFQIFIPGVKGISLIGNCTESYMRILKRPADSLTI